jgi:hypothetical protein
MKKTDKKGILINLDEPSRIYLRDLAEKNSSSQSYEVRRLIKDEQKREDSFIPISK